MAALVAAPMRAQDAAPGESTTPSANGSASAPASGSTSTSSSTTPVKPAASPSQRDFHVPLLRTFFDDQKAIWTGPFRMQLDDVRWAAPLAGITAGAIVSDAQFT